MGFNVIRLDDIYLLYLGKMVEINNMDVEGRLVLVDGVFYVCKDLGVDIILDMVILIGV